MINQRLTKKNEQNNKQITYWFFQNNDFFEKKSIFSQNKIKRNETSITRFHKYFIVFNVWNIWRDSIDKSINDETFLTIFANKKRTKNFWKSKKKRNKWNRSWKNRKLTRNVFANIYWFKSSKKIFDWF